MTGLPCPSCGGAGHFPADAQFPVCPPPRNADGTWACNFCRGTGEVGDAARWTGRPLFLPVSAPLAAGGVSVVSAGGASVGATANPKEHR